MIEKNTLVEVTNRDNGRVGYTIPDMNNLYRVFMPGEKKQVTFEELQKLSWVPGGKAILENYLVIKDKDIVEELLSDVEPEYFYSKEDVEKLLKTGTIEQFLDTLDFAPEGVIELIKSMSVELELNDVAKREAIFKATGFDVSKAIEINRETKAEEENKDSHSTRRAAPINAAGAGKERRTAAPQSYKVVKK